MLPFRFSSTYSYLNTHAGCENKSKQHFYFGNQAVDKGVKMQMLLEKNGLV